MAAKTWYATNNLASVHVEMDETSPGSDATASPVTGWVVSTGGTNHSAMFAHVERAASTFVDTGPPDGSIDTTNGDCLRTTNTYSGDFASANWTVSFTVIAVTRGGTQDGRMRCRLLRGTNADGSGATEITAAQQQGGLVTNLLTSAQQTSTATFNPGAFSVSGEYIFVQIAWERTGAGDMSTADVDLRIGTTATQVVSSDFTEATIVDDEFWQNRVKPRHTEWGGYLPVVEEEIVEQPPELADDDAWQPPRAVSKQRTRTAPIVDEDIGTPPEPTLEFDDDAWQPSRAVLTPPSPTRAALIVDDDVVPEPVPPLPGDDDAWQPRRLVPSAERPSIASADAGDEILPPPEPIVDEDPPPRLVYRAGRWLFNLWQRLWYGHEDRVEFVEPTVTPRESDSQSGATIGARQSASRAGPVTVGPRISGTQTTATIGPRESDSEDI